MFQRLLLIVFLFFLQGCWNLEPPKLPQLKPEGNTQAERIQWFRRTFQAMITLELKKKDYGDRIRRFCQKFPLLAKNTYIANYKQIERRRKKGYKLSSLEKNLLQMSFFLKQVHQFPPASQFLKRKESEDKNEF